MHILLTEDTASVLDSAESAQAPGCTYIRERVNALTSDLNFILVQIVHRVPP
jgi:hypothetical protein